MDRPVQHAAEQQCPLRLEAVARTEPELVRVAGQPGLFRVEMHLGPLVWVFAIGSRPSDYIRDRWESRGDVAAF